MQRTISNHHLNTILVLVMLLGTATLAILALAAITFAAVLIHTAIDSLVEVVQTIIGLYTHGDPLTRLFILGCILLLCWKAAPYLVRYARRQIAAAPTLFARQKATWSGPAYVNADREDAEAETAQEAAQPDDQRHEQDGGPTTSPGGMTKAKSTSPRTNRRSGNTRTTHGQPSRAQMGMAARAST